MGQPEDPFKPFERMLFGFLRLIADGNFQNENDKWKRASLSVQGQCDNFLNLFKIFFETTS